MQRDNYIQVDAETLVKAEGFMSDMPEKVEAAYRNALLRARENVRSNSTREITKEYAIRPMDIRAEQTIRLSQAKMSSGFTAKLRYSSGRLPLTRFDYFPTTRNNIDKMRRVTFYAKNDEGEMEMWHSHPGRPAEVRVKKKSSRQIFKNAFVLKFKSGHAAIVERRIHDALYDGRFPLGQEVEGDGSRSGKSGFSQFYGPSVSQMLDNMDVKKSLTESAQETFQKRFAHEIDRMVAGWGMK